MSNFFKRTKRAWEENEWDKQHPNSITNKGYYRDFVRKYPLNDDGMFPQQEALFPRQVLEPLYEQWKRYHDNGSNNAEQFFIFLLKQAKPTPLTQTIPSGSSTVQNTEE